MQLELEYKGEAEKTRIYLRNHNKEYSTIDDIQTTKFHSVNVRTSDLVAESNINMAEFSVDDWWKDRYAIPRELSTPEYSALITMGIDQSGHKGLLLIVLVLLNVCMH